MALMATPQLFKSKWGWVYLIPVGAIMAMVLARGMAGRLWFGYVHEIGLTVLGVCLFIMGFCALRKYRIVADTPTSKVRSAAMGVCELKGAARAKSSLKSPITGADCVYYEFRIECRHRSSKGGTYWVTEKEGRSTNYFYLDDGTGAMLVDPLSAETHLAVDSQKTDKVNGRVMRYTEWYVKPEDAIYVLGTVRQFDAHFPSRQELLTERLRKLKEDKGKMKAVDADGDGTVSAEEWDRARAHVEEELLREELARPPEKADSVVIAAGDTEKTFIFADCGERKIMRWLSLKGAGLVSCGALLIIGMCMSAVARAGLLPAYLAIPWEVFYRH